MADDLFRRPFGGGLGVEWDDAAEGWHFDAGRCGPAGLASVELPRGIEVAVDVAEPVEVLSVWVPNVEDLTQAEDVVLSLTRDRVGLGRLALAEDVLDGAFHPSDLALTLATVDRALASRALGDLFDSTELADRRAAAIDAVHASADDLLDAPRPYLIAEGLRRLGGPEGFDGSDAALGALIEALREAGRDQLSAADGDLPMAAAAPAAAATVEAAALQRTEYLVAPVSRLLDVVDFDALPDGLRPGQIAARATTASEIEIRVGVAVPSKPWWVRVHIHDLMVAAAPILPDGPDSGIARLLVPPSDLHRVEVDVTTRPDDQRPSRTTRTIGRAVRQGRGAARSDRTERYAEAERAWRDCARTWQQAEDKPRSVAAVERAELALRYGPVRNLPGEPLLSDLVAD